MGFKYNGIHSSSMGVYKVTEVRGRGILPPIESRLLETPGRHGVYYQGFRFKERVIEVDVVLADYTQQDLWATVRVLGAWLQPGQVRPLVFDDEPGLTWMAVLDGETPLKELVMAGTGTLRFLVPDAVALGAEHVIPLADGTIVNAEGTAPAWPTIRVTANQAITYVAVATDADDYILLGRPPAAEETPAPREELLLRDACNTLTGWTQGGQPSDIMNGAIAGSMTSTNGEFRASDYGTGTGWHGPLVKRGLGTELQDFIVEVLVRQNNNGNASQMGRAEVYLLDNNGVIVAMISIRDLWAGEKKNQAVAYVGNSSGTKLIKSAFANNPVHWNGYDGFLKVQRVGQKWFFQWGLIDPVTGKRHTRLPVDWYDTAGAYLGKVSQIALWLAAYQTYPATDQAFKQVDVWRVNAVGPTQVPYIADPGDILEIDCGRHAVYRNGEPRMDLLDPSSKFFRLVPGQPVAFGVAPASGEITAELVYQERWL